MQQDIVAAVRRIRKYPRQKLPGASSHKIFLTSVALWERRMRGDVSDDVIARYEREIAKTFQAPRVYVELDVIAWGLMTGAFSPPRTEKGFELQDDRTIEMDGHLWDALAMYCALYDAAVRPYISAGFTDIPVIRQAIENGIDLDLLRGVTS